MSATNRKAVVPLSRGGVEIDPESRRGVARQGPARRPVGRPLISAEKGLEMRPVGAFPCPDGTGTASPNLRHHFRIFSVQRQDDAGVAMLSR